MHIKSELFNAVSPLQDSSSEISLRNQFVGAGLRLGTDAKVAFTPNIALFGQFSIAELAGRFHIRENEKFSIAGLPGEVFESPTHFKRYSVKPVMDMRFGLAGGFDFNKKRSRFELSVAYEFNLWISQNQLYRLYNISPAIKQPGDFSFHGLSVQTSFYF